jgi:hypothetical protein
MIAGGAAILPFGNKKQNDPFDSGRIAQSKLAGSALGAGHEFNLNGNKATVNIPDS